VVQRRRRSARKSRTVVLDGVAALSKRYGARVVSDQHLARVVADGLRERGVERVVTQAWTGTLLTEAFRAIGARVIADTITLPHDETLVQEPGRIRSRTRAGGSAFGREPKFSAARLSRLYGDAYTPEETRGPLT
jgi:hypothetical protein